MVGSVVIKLIRVLKGYILDPKMVGAWQGSTPSMDTWDFFQQKFTPLKALHQFYYIYKKSNLLYLLNFGNRPK